jgi:hypothetical protein
MMAALRAVDVLSSVLVFFVSWCVLASSAVKNGMLSLSLFLQIIETFLVL